MTTTEVLPQGVKKGKSELFWEAIRTMLKEKPGQIIKVNTYNHQTVAYRIRRDINYGYNPIFSEVGQWKATLVKDEENPFYGPRSGKVTYHYDLFIVYTPPVKN
jgi:hypothetical protein